MGSDKADPVVKNSIGKGLWGVIGQADQMGIVRVDIGDEEGVSFSIIGDVEGAKYVEADPLVDLCDLA